VPAAPRVRIFLRSYNRRDYLEAAVDAILAQTCDDFDLVIIDDASTDGASDLARAYANTFPDRISAIVKPVNRGLMDSIELSLALADETEYVAFVDDDDLWQPGKLTRQLAEFERDPALGLVATEALIIDEYGRTTDQRFSDFFGLPRKHDLASALFNANFLCASSVLVRSSALRLARDHYEGFRGGCFDMYMWIVIAAHADSRWLEEPLTCYRRTEDALSVRHADEMWRETHVLRRYAFDHFPTLRAKVGENSGEERINGDALFRAMLNLRDGNLREYWWFSWQVLRRLSMRWSAIWAWLSLRTIFVSGSRRLMAFASRSTP
jgi:glycosyltransferase involved in cell wall biosynthesis